MMKPREELFTELLEDVARDFNIEVQKAIGKIHVSLPNMIFQEKHTSDFLWRKRTWYKYCKYFEGSMVGLGKYDNGTIKLIEKGK